MTGTHIQRNRRRNQSIFRWVVLGLALAYFLIPMISLLDFSIRFPLTGKVDFDSWAVLFGGDESGRLDLLGEGLVNSLIMAAMTVVISLALLLPTMVLVKLKSPKLTRVVEFISLLPLTIPAVVLVVGLAPIYLVIETARSFGASWWTVLMRVIVPNVRTAIISAVFISVAVVMGEFTFARMLARVNLQTALFQVNLSDGQIAAAVSLLALGGTTLLLVLLDLFVGLRESARRKGPPAPLATSVASPVPTETSAS